MPFEDLPSDEAQWRLAVCRPHGAFQDAMFEAGGIPKYAHITGGGVDFRRRSTSQLVSMMGFVLNRNDGAFRRRVLSEDEIAGVHERHT